jgi:hypothetical protein
MIHPKSDGDVHTRTAFCDHRKRNGEGTGDSPETGLWIQQGLTDTSRTARNPGDDLFRWQSAFSTIFSV